MARIELVNDAYELRMPGLNELCVGAVSGRRAADVVAGVAGWTKTRLTARGVGGTIAVVADHRARFLGALFALWSEKHPALLVPNPNLLEQRPAALCLRADASLAEHQVESLGLELDWAPSSPLAQVLTSGSSGAPTEHVKSAGQLLGEARALVQLLALCESDTVMATTASHHVYGLLFGVLAPLLASASIVVDDRCEPDAFHPHRLAELAAETETTTLITVPAHLRSIIEAAPNLSGIRRVVSSAAPLDPRDAKHFEDRFGIEVLDVLGSTETGGIATRRPERSLYWTPLPGVEVSVDERQVLSIDSPWADGAPGKVTSGERAELLKDGSFSYLGRADGIVKVGGKRISLLEVENIARQIPGVDDAVAFAQPVASLRGTEICLVATPRTLTREELKSALRKELDPVFLPRKLRLLDSLPRDERGKLKRASLLELFKKAPL